MAGRQAGRQEPRKGPCVVPGLTIVDKKAGRELSLIHP